MGLRLTWSSGRALGAGGSLSTRDGRERSHGRPQREHPRGERGEHPLWDCNGVGRGSEPRRGPRTPKPCPTAGGNPISNTRQQREALSLDTGGSPTALGQPKGKPVWVCGVGLLTVLGLSTRGALRRRWVRLCSFRGRLRGQGGAEDIHATRGARLLPLEPRAQAAVGKHREPIIPPLSKTP